jgi:hypothetical protein
MRPASTTFGACSWTTGLHADASICVAAELASICFPDLAQRMHVAAAAGHARFETLYVSNIPWMLAQPRGFFDEAHGAHAADPEQPVLRQVRRNLAQIAPYFRHVLSAARLRDRATPDNLQWRAELLSPAEFLAPEYWAGIDPTGTWRD